MGNVKFISNPEKLSRVVIDKTKGKKDKKEISGYLFPIGQIGQDMKEFFLTYAKLFSFQ